jgi:hypothetical protein
VDGGASALNVFTLSHTSALHRQQGWADCVKSVHNNIKLLPRDYRGACSIGFPGWLLVAKAVNGNYRF